MHKSLISFSFIPTLVSASHLQGRISRVVVFTKPFLLLVDEVSNAIAKFLQGKQENDSKHAWQSYHVLLFSSYFHYFCYWHYVIEFLTKMIQNEPSIDQMTNASDKLTVGMDEITVIENMQQMKPVSKRLVVIVTVAMVRFFWGSNWFVLVLMHSRKAPKTGNIRKWK